MKRGISLLIAITIILSLAACGSSSSDSGELIGVWSGSWEYAGRDINCSVQFKRDGTYVDNTYVNHELQTPETGTWEMKGNKVILYIDGNKGHLQEYKYSGGKLINNGHSLTKEK